MSCRRTMRWAGIQLSLVTEMNRNKKFCENVMEQPLKRLKLDYSDQRKDCGRKGNEQLWPKPQYGFLNSAVERPLET